MGNIKYKLVVDSCCDLTEEYKRDSRFVSIPLTLSVGGVKFIDDDTFDQLDFIRRCKESTEVAKSACPSPEDFMNAYKGDEDIFVVTLAQPLSGTYNSARLAKEMYIEEYGHKNIEVFSAEGASVSESLLAFKIQELCEMGLSFEEVVKKAHEFNEENKIFFVLETLDTLRKNGRMTGLQAFFATTLNIKPIMTAKKGVIEKMDQARGINKALAQMCKYAGERIINPENKTLGISHCNCLERAEYVKNEMLKHKKFKNVYIVNMAGVSTLYANDGGIILSV